MSLDDVRHVEACALLRRVVEDVGDQLPYRSAIEGWLEENHPPPDAYIAAMSSLASDRPEPMPKSLHDELVPRGFE